MTQDEKLKKASNDFTLLDEEQQDYILGILQALVFAKHSSDNNAAIKNKMQTESPNLP
ncbi:MAG: hypothetical protein LBU82_08355 [Treponema sp.]|jgi:hypothetical protein|nr:hypothetical protein [Treponema sp.]